MRKFTLLSICLACCGLRQRADVYRKHLQRQPGRVSLQHHPSSECQKLSNTSYANLRSPCLFGKSPLDKYMQHIRVKLKPLAMFVMLLLALDPAASFEPLCTGSHFASKPAFAGIQLVSLNDEFSPNSRSKDASTNVGFGGSTDVDGDWLRRSSPLSMGASAEVPQSSAKARNGQGRGIGTIPLDGSLSLGDAEFEKSAEELIAEVRSIMVKDLDWSRFANNFTVIDQTGAKIEGLRPNKLYLKLLRIARTRLEVEDDVRLEFASYNISDGSPPCYAAMARLKIKLGGGKVPISRFWERENPVEFDAEMVVCFNDGKQLESVQLEKWLVNGRQFPAKLQLFPNVPSSDNLVSSLSKVKTWARDVKQLNMAPFILTPTEYFRENIAPTRRDILFQAAGQIGLLVLGSEIAQVRNENRNTDRPRDFMPIDGLEDDIKKVLDEEPSWANFDENFCIIDKTGDVLVKGLGPNILLFKALRAGRLIVTDGPLKDDLQVQTTRAQQEFPDGGRDEVLIASGILEIDTKKELEVDTTKNIEILTLSSFTNQRDGNLARKLGFPTLPLTVVGQVTFSFTETDRGRRVDYMRIDSLYVNERETEFPKLWPGLREPTFDDLGVVVGVGGKAPKLPESGLTRNYPLRL